MVSIRKSEVGGSGQLLAANGRPWERTGIVDVELLLRWAYGPQMVDRFERQGLHAIEAEISGYEPRGHSACGVGQLMQIGHLGCRIDRGGGVSVRDAVHPAAFAVAEAVAGLEHGGFVRQHARAGTRPVGWVEPERKARAAIWVKPWREAMVEYQGPGRKGGYCQVILTWDAGREAWGRAEYVRWWSSLADLAWALSQRALGFVVSGPGAPAEPWIGAEIGKRAEPSSIVIDQARGAPGAPPNGSSQAGGV